MTSDAFKHSKGKPYDCMPGQYCIKRHEGKPYAV